MLVLGGTGEASELATALAESSTHRVITSMAGRLRNPELPAGEVRVGGFDGAAGMMSWLREHAIDLVVDATHPFAGNITSSAQRAAAAVGLPLLVLRRSGWRPGPGDDWHWVPTISAAAEELAGLGPRVFLTTGRQDVSAFAGLAEHEFLLRCVEPPESPVPPRLEVLLDRGPYTVAGELDLLRSYRVDVLVTKNSGGAKTSAKLDACRELGVPVVIVRRPPTPGGVSRARSVREALHWLDEHAAGGGA